MLPKKLSKDVIESWPEIFGDVDLNVVPIHYLCSVEIKFKDKKIWKIDIKPEQRENEWLFVETNLREFIRIYKKKIVSIDFKLDADKIRKDITKETNKFLRRRKLT